MRNISKLTLLKRKLRETEDERASARLGHEEADKRCGELERTIADLRQASAAFGIERSALPFRRIVFNFEDDKGRQIAGGNYSINRGDSLDIGINIDGDISIGTDKA